MPYENVKLFAVWEPDTFTVNYNSNGGTGQLSRAEVRYGDSVPLPKDVSIYRDGLFLTGWAKTDNAKSTLKRYMTAPPLKRECRLSFAISPLIPMMGNSPCTITSSRSLHGAAFPKMRFALPATRQRRNSATKCMRSSAPAQSVSFSQAQAKWEQALIFRRNLRRCIILIYPGNPLMLNIPNGTKDDR